MISVTARKIAPQDTDSQRSILWPDDAVVVNVVGYSRIVSDDLSAKLAGMLCSNSRELLVKKKAALIVFFGAAIIAPLAVWSEQIPVFKFTEKPGPNAVGLRVVEQYDYSRTYRKTTDDLGKAYQGERARPLQTLIWYPAENSKGKPMTVRDYTGLLPAETSFDEPNLSKSDKDWIAAMKPSLETDVWAVRDAKPLPDHFPVVIYAPSFSSYSWENADLCEYLASHGYVVIASPDFGVSTRSMTADLAGINAQAQDISFLIGYAKTLRNTDISEIAVAGFSWGGISNLFAAARDNRIKALVALDGSMRYYPGLVKQADLHPEQLTIPLLFFTATGLSLEDQARYLADAKNVGPSVLNGWIHGDLVIVHMLGLVHTEFSSVYQRNEDVWKRRSQEPADDYGREDGIVGYAWVARYTLQFLNAYLKHDPPAMAYLKNTPAQNSVPRHVLTVKFRAAKGLAPSLDCFRAEIGRQGFSHAGDIYAAIQKENSDFKLDENALDSWSQDLISRNYLLEATELLKLNAQIHPESGNAYFSLAEAYAKSGQKQLAVENYNKALQKDPDNESVKQKLMELDATAHPSN